MHNEMGDFVMIVGDYLMEGAKNLELRYLFLPYTPLIH